MMIWRGLPPSTLAALLVALAQSRAPAQTQVKPEAKRGHGPHAPAKHLPALGSRE